MSSFYPPKLTPRPAAASVAVEVHCHRCRASLAGLKSTDKCPQCGVGVAVSMRGSEMRYSDPKWIGRLKTGANLCFGSTLLMTIGIAVNAAITQSPEHPAVDPRIPAGLMIAGALGGLLSTWLLTIPDPSGAGEKTYGTARRLARWMPLAILGLAGFLLATIFLKLPLPSYWIVGIFLCILDIIELVGFVAMLQYLSKLAARMRDPRLAERCRTLRVGWSLAGGLLVIIEAFYVFVMPTNFARDNDLGSLALALLAVAGLSGSVMLVMWILMLLRLSKSLAEQRRLAIGHWQE